MLSYNEVQGDLFKIAGPEYTLVHCVSADGAMGAGIAKTFRNKYPEMPKYVQSKASKQTDKVVAYKR